MSNANIRIPPDSSGKRIDCSEMTVFGGTSVQRQRVAIADPINPQGLALVTNGALHVRTGTGLVLGRSGRLEDGNGDGNGTNGDNGNGSGNGGNGIAPPNKCSVDGSVQLPPDSTGKKLDTSQITRGAENVHRQRIVLADSDEAADLAVVSHGALHVDIYGIAGAEFDITKPSDGDVLAYDGSSGKWITRTIAAQSSFADSEVVNGSGTSWTLRREPSPVSSLQLFQYIADIGYILVYPYQISGRTVTTGHSIPAGQLLAWYRYAAVGRGAPTITGVWPSTGTIGGGTAVTITGTNFGPGTTVSFGGIQATNVTVVNSTTIQTITPPGFAMEAVAIRVLVDGQLGVLDDGFTYVAGTLPSAPTVTSVSPSSGPTTGGTQVTITGTNFAAGATVSFGGVAAGNVTVLSSTSITATTPAAGAGIVAVTVNVNGLTGGLATGFTYTSVAPTNPTLTSISPTSGTTAGGTVVTLTGTNFTGTAIVTIGGVAATNVLVTNSTTITATTPANSAGVKTVSVTVSGETLSLTNAFTYVQPAPTVTGISPTSGTTDGGTSVTITGTNFVSGSTTVTFGGTAATVGTVTATSITVTTPARAAGAVPVVVTVSGLTATSPTNYTYVTPVGPAPTITSVTPNTGTTAGGTSVTITGTNFASPATVTFGGQSATGVTVNSATSITCTTPAGTAGAVAVAVTVASQQGSLPSGFTYIAPAPTITSITPNTGTTAGGTSITINGTNFVSFATTVTIGGAAATVTAVTATSIACTTPAGTAGPQNVVVTVSGLSATSTGGFTYTATAPTVTSITPTTGTLGGGTPFTITGTNFSGSASVTFGGVAATGVTVASATSITGTAPALGTPTVTSINPTTGVPEGGTGVTIKGTNFAGTVSVAVTVGGQTLTLTNAYTYGAPTVTSISPTVGSENGGTTITIKGTNFK